MEDKWWHLPNLGPIVSDSLFGLRRPAQNLDELTEDAMLPATKAGVSPQLMYEIIQNSAARAGILEYKAPSIFRGAWDTNFSLKWMHKDITLMLESGRELVVPLPALAVVHELFGASISRGHADDDYSSAITLLEEWAGAQVRSPD